MAQKPTNDPSETAQDPLPDDIAPLDSDSEFSSGSAKEPIQQRSRRRVNAILDATEQLLMEADPDDLSYSKIAALSGIGRGSVYQFFPKIGDLLMALTRRNSIIQSATLGEAFRQRQPRTLAAAVDCIVDSAVMVYNSSPAARRVCLVSGGRTRNYFDKDYNRWYARKLRELLGDLAPPKVKGGDVIEVAGMIAYSIYALAVLRDGYITPFYVEQAKALMLFELSSQPAPTSP